MIGLYRAGTTLCFGREDDLCSGSGYLNLMAAVAPKHEGYSVQQDER